MTKYYEDIVVALTPHADAAMAAQMKRYMKNKFEFFGIPSPKLRLLTASFLQKGNLPDVPALPDLARQFWNAPERELQYFAIELLKKYVGRSPKEWIEFYEHLITHKSWWDTVDGLAAWQVGSYFQSHPGQIPIYTKRWMDSDNIWLRRTCLLFQLKYKEKTDFVLMKSLIIPLAGSKEFFIQKAIGWALREYSKIYPQKVMEFANDHALAKLSYREATRIALKG